MHAKRHISTSATDLHMSDMSDSVKRLAIAREGHPVAAPSILPPVRAPSPILTVMSNAKDDFTSRYEVIREIGKGGFSTVYQCRQRTSGRDFAVKVIDLRPLRLRERFNPARLKREVDIMRRLCHPNIIQFVEVYEDADHLMMVMEYCPGMELFDVILAKKYLREDEARPIFAQVSRALFYLHSLQIIHRDIKPENVLILDTPDPVTGEVVAKLLDFGLSKNASGGSAAKTFVGTPCYLAPEVEYTSKGLGGTYGLPADCWSLGAVLYVMLVARFPEFEQDIYGKVIVKLSPALWNNVSSEAKDLIRGLMNTNPAARFTMADVLQHPWLGRYRATQEELTAWTVNTTDLGHSLQQEEERISDQQQRNQAAYAEPEMTSTGYRVHQQAMVIRPADPAANPASHMDTSAVPYSPDQFKVTPLLHLQRSIATCFEEAHSQYQFLPEVATQVRRGAVLCRQQMVESTKMLRKIEQTAGQVLDLFPDLELAIDEGEPQLANEFFNMVKGWVVELRERVGATQTLNKASMGQIQRVVEHTTLGLTQQSHGERASTTAAAQAETGTAPGLRSLDAKTIQQLTDKLSTIGVSATTTSHLLQDLLAKQEAFSSSQPAGPSNTTPATYPHLASVDADNKANGAIDANRFVDLFVSLFQASQPAMQQTPPQAPTTTAQDAARSMEKSSSPSHPPVPPPPFPSPVQAWYQPMDSINTTPPPPPAFSSSSDDSAFASPLRPAPQLSLQSVFQKPVVASPNSIGTLSSSQSTLGGGAGGAGEAMDVQPQLPAAQHSSPTVSVSMTESTAAPPPATETASCAQGAGQELLVVEGDDAYVPDLAIMDGASSPRATVKLAEALQKLRQVDIILEQLDVFWANTEVVLDLLTKKGQHVEQFIGFSSKPKLMARFKERMEEYKRFWEGVRLMCSKYIAYDNQKNVYGFLEKTDDMDKVDSLDSLATAAWAEQGFGGSPTSSDKAAGRKAAGVGGVAGSGGRR